MALNKNQSVITHIEVSFAEIDALYDVTLMQRAVSDSNGTRVIYNTKPNKGPASSGAFAMFTEDGSLYSEVAKELRGVYRYMRVTEAPYFVWQTFDRKRSIDLDDRYVYVWAADQKDGSGLRLLHELKFKGGSFHFLKLDPNDRTPQGGPQSRLLLQLISFQDATPKHLYYFFYLTPLQLIWGQIDAMTQDVPARAMRLWDDFYTDVYKSGDPKTAVSVDQVLRGGGPASLPPHMMYRMHLLNPLQEALRRSAIYKKALAKWQNLQRDLGKDDEYRLAKRLQAFTAPEGSEYYSEIGPKLRPYLDQKENNSERLYMLTLLTAQDVIRWIGSKHQREKFNDRSDTWFSDGHKRFPSLQDNGADPWHNTFTQASLDFMEADPSVLTEVQKVVRFVHEQLDATPNGEKWMESILKMGVEGKLDPLESGASEYLFQVYRKGDDAALKGVGWLFKEWAAVWVKHYRTEALSSLQKWMLAKHGIALEAASISKRMSGVSGLGWARKKDIDKLDIEPRRIGELRATEHTVVSKFKLVQAGIEAANLYFALYNTYKHSNDPWVYVEAIAAAADFYHALEEVHAVPDILVKFKYGEEIVKVPVFAVVAGALDTVLAAKDVVKSDTFGQQIGNGLRTLGGGCTVVGAVTSEEVVGLFVWAAGLALQSGGNYMAAQFDPIHTFLHHTRWGEVGSWEGLTDAVKNQNSDWYRGDLRKLPGDMAAQHRCLDQFIYNFEPEIVFEADRSDGASLGVRIKVQRGVLGPHTRWQIEAELLEVMGETPGAPERFAFQPTDDASNDAITAGLEYPLKTWSRKDSIDPMTYIAVVHIDVSVTVRLDIFGDKVHVLERTNSGVFNLESKVEAGAPATGE